MRQVFDWVIVFCCWRFFDSLSITFDNLFWRSGRLSNKNRYLAGYFSPLVWHDAKMKVKRESCAAVVSCLCRSRKQQRGSCARVCFFFKFAEAYPDVQETRKLLNFGEHANKMSDAEFRRFYRVTRGRFGWLCGNLRSTLAKKRARISPEVTLAISLRYLAGGS